jgi:hypothetical protein
MHASTLTEGLPPGAGGKPGHLKITRVPSVARGADRPYPARRAEGVDRARRADEIQYEAGYGPALQRLVEDTVYAFGDIAADGRRPEQGRRRLTELGVASMLAYRLALENDQMIASLNLYAGRPHAFDDEALALGMLLATHGALAASAASNRERAHQLQRALETSRDIGMAIGILMHQHKLTRSQAFDLLRIASQNSNRKVHEIAVEVADTGVLTLPGRMHPEDRRTPASRRDTRDRRR